MKSLNSSVVYSSNTSETVTRAILSSRTCPCNPGIQQFLRPLKSASVILYHQFFFFLNWPAQNRSCLQRSTWAEITLTLCNFTSLTWTVFRNEFKSHLVVTLTLYGPTIIVSWRGLSLRNFVTRNHYCYFLVVLYDPENITERILRLGSGWSA